MCFARSGSGGYFSTIEGGEPFSRDVTFLNSAPLHSCGGGDGGGGVIVLNPQVVYDCCDSVDKRSSL